MKVGILTFYKVLNYGAVLQAYALRQSILRMGHECVFVPVQPAELTRTYSSVRLRSLRKFSYIARLYRNRFLVVPFERFRATHLPDAACATDPATFCRSTPELDAVIVGSDQIWNRKLTGLTMAFFLPYSKQRTRKVAYAASSGGDLSFLADTNVVNYLRDFDGLSVREQSLEFAVRSAGISCQTVLDPTLLISDYSGLIGGNQFGDYVGMYHVVDSPLLVRGISRIRDATGLPVINFGPKFLPQADRNLLGVSPEDWIGMVHHAKFLYTNSFHGVAFALNFSKRFCYVPNGMDSDARCLNLLESLDINSPIARSEVDIARSVNIIPSDVSERLQALRDASHEFLRTQLS